MTTRRFATLCTIALLGACRSGPPTPADYRALGDIASGDARFEVRDAYVWRQPVGDATTVLLADRALPELPADDAWAVVDLALLLAWSQTPHAELALDGRGELTRVYSSNGGRGSSNAACDGNPGACDASVLYVGSDAIDASYAFGKEYDATVVAPIHRQSQVQVAMMDRSTERMPREASVRRSDDHDRMAERYSRVRAALDQNSAMAFLEANGYDKPTREALAAFDGIAGGVQWLKQQCPQATSFEGFGNDGAFGSLLVRSGEREMAVYFMRRGDEWLLHSCGESN